MKDLNHDICSLTETFIAGVRSYGLQETTLVPYRATCNAIIVFANETGERVFSNELMTRFSKHIEKRYENHEICHKYLRHQQRVIRMLTSLAENGEIDFSAKEKPIRKYPVSDETAVIVEEILDTNNLRGKTRILLKPFIRHLLWFSETLDTKPSQIDDDILMRFLITEIPTTNKNSAGIALRCTKYVSEYLRAKGNTRITRDYSMLKFRKAHTQMIPAYSEEEVRRIVEVIDIDTDIGKRDLAIILLAYCTGLRGEDLSRLRLDDIDWKRQRISVIQSKTHQPITAELNGETLNALADYILNARPECNAPELFITVNAPYRRLKGRLNAIIEKYCGQACVEKIPRRSFHSLRRSFETVMVSRGISIETASQMMGHRRIDEDKHYISYDRNIASLIAMDFAEVPITGGKYADLCVSTSTAGGGSK